MLTPPIKRKVAGSSQDTFSCSLKRSKSSQETIEDIVQSQEGEDTAIESRTPEEILDEPQKPEMFVLLSELEWDRLQSGGEYLLRPFRSVQDELGVVLRVEDSNYCVGKISLADKEKLPAGDAISGQRAEHLCSSMYSKEHIKSVAKRSKILWVWKVAESESYSHRLELSWVDAQFKNRVFKLDPSKFVKVGGHGPQSLDLKETADYMVKRLPSAMWQVILQQFQKLHGKTLRVGTTCSGSDICISVIKETLDYLKATQAGEV